jgi:3-methyl-2-oxobutanoate hydroxymethyltransferase
MVLNSIGAGKAGDVIFLFFEDICGESENPPRHAQSWGDGAAIRRALDAERRRAVAGFRDAVKTGAYPDAAHTVQMRPGEMERLRETLDKRPR